MADSNGSVFGTVPQSVKSLAYLITTIGTTGVLLLGGGWAAWRLLDRYTETVVVAVPNHMSQLGTSLQQVSKEHTIVSEQHATMAQSVTRNGMQIDRLAESLDEITDLTWALCYNAARDPAARQTCDAARRRDQPPRDEAPR